MEEHGALAVCGERLHVPSMTVINSSGVSAHMQERRFCHSEVLPLPVIPNQTLLIPPQRSFIHSVRPRCACLDFISRS